MNMNPRIMAMLQRAMEDDPELDLLSVIPKSYQSKLAGFKQQAGSTTLSAAVKLNLDTIDELQTMVNEDPEVDLLSQFPKNYTIVREGRGHRYQKRKLPEKIEKTQPDDVLRHFNRAVSATIELPLSNAVTTLLATHMKSITDSMNPGESLAQSLKLLFQQSEKLWESQARGAVFKCSDDIVAKVVTGVVNSGEYTAMAYLAEHAPDIPAPRPHGLIDLGPYKVIFMSYIPSMTLAKAWPTLTLENKVSIQRQLGDIFGRLRMLRQQDGYPLGGIGGQGVTDCHREDYRSRKVISTGAGYENWQFSISHFAGEHYVKCLRSFLPPPVQESVFTHCDVRKDNIMVKMDENNGCVVTGIIDWEESGFYPDYHECMKVTNTYNTRDHDDWFDFLPDCIAPQTFPVRWLVDRLWDRNIKYSD